ncbi:alanine-zipper protein [Singulisphaera sp. Ch08]|uniref:Alanine-zipper protein n=1 Tax=Singulisphaera sp. Ch08 TaxID=3120278 RepID=A0AAU7CPH5_9BACT
MTQSETPVSRSESEKTASSVDAAAVAESPPPAPEPWTGERVREWNAYYDLYVVLGVVLLVFVASANKISHSAIWSQLKAGQIMAAKGVPVPLVTDTFSYTMEGQRWINIPWLFEWSHALLYDGAYRLVPPDNNDTISPTRRSEQVGAGALVGLTALVRVATLLVLLGIRRTGPGLWWSALCATIALGAVYSPLGVMMGGIAGPASVSPETWGQLFLAIELLLLHRAINLGRPRAAYGLIPLFLLWANVSDSFLIGLLVLTATVIGRLFTAKTTTPKGEADPLPLSRGLILLGICAAVCLLNPSWHLAYLAAIDPFLQLFQPAGGVISSEQLSYFGKAIRGRDPAQANSVWLLLIAFYFVIVLVGLFSFALNRKRFSVGRFLSFAVMAFLWALYIRFGSLFAIVFAATLILNGQEWYQDRFGIEGRLGRGWSIWSTGGRFVTILLVFLMVAKCLTGYGRTAGDSVFGFGFNPDDFAFEAADYLRTKDLQGQILNTTRLQGDSLIWKAFPLQKPYIDGRSHLYPQPLQEELHQIRLALAEDAVETWKPLLDRFEISAVMIEPSTAPKTYRALMQSPNWIPFYDDGSVVMFGRTDAPAKDLAFFKSSRLDPEVLAYQSTKSLPPFDRPPTPVGRMDEVFQNRFGVPPQPHTEAAERWLQGLPSESDASSLPDPARCLLAIREARIALSRKPDDTQAYRILSRAYRDLMVQESALLSGLKLTPENRDAINRVALQPQLLINRFRQRITSLNFAIQSTPPPRRAEERLALFRLNLELSELYMSMNFLDLARDRLQAAIAHSDQENPEFLSQLSQQFNQLDNRVKQVQDSLTEMLAEQQASPINRADFAMGQGAPGLAIQELEEALQINVAVNTVKPLLIDLYCDTGQPEKALDILATSTTIDDPTLGTEPGTPAYRQGRVYFLLGNYSYASSLWKNYAIRQIRLERSFAALGAGASLLHGEAKPASTLFMSLPGKLTTQANWEYELALCELESGESTQAAEDFTSALTLLPTLPTRPIIAFYLEKLGQPVPPLPKTPDETESTKAKEEAAKPKVEEAKPKAEEVTPKAEEAKPKAEEAKPKAEEAKPKAEEAKPKAEEAKPKAEEAKPKAEEAKPKAEEAKPKAEEAKPKAEEAKPKAEEAKPKAEEAKPTEKEAKPKADKPAQVEPKVDPPADQPTPEKAKEAEAAKPSL